VQVNCLPHCLLPKVCWLRWECEFDAYEAQIDGKSDRLMLLSLWLQTLHHETALRNGQKSMPNPTIRFHDLIREVRRQVRLLWWQL
jgi:hypothetical protein